MIHRASRDKLGYQIRRYMAGRITNWELDDSGDGLEDDGAVAIWFMLWTTYSDFPRFYATGRRRLHGDLRETYLRVILFLDTDLEYRWPAADLGSSFPWLRNILTFGRAGRDYREAQAAYDQKWHESGDLSVWPFQTTAEYQSALQFPRRLAGGEGDLTSPKDNITR